MSHPPVGSNEPTLPIGAPQPAEGGTPAVSPQEPAHQAPGYPPAVPDQAYPATRQYPVTRQYPAAQQYPAADAYPGAGSAGAYPGAPQPATSYGQPMSAPPYGQPMSAPPASGMPYGAMPPASGMPYGAPAPSGGRKVLVLALVAALLFVVGAVMTGLYATKASELNRTQKRLTAQVADRDGRIAANATEIEGLKRDLQTANDKIKATEQDLAGTKNDRDEQERQKKLISSCLDLLNKAFSATSKAAFDKAITAADKACAEADKYL